MPSISSIDIASFAIANAAAGPDVARAFLLQGSLGANGPLIAAKLITDQFAAMQTQLAATTASADSLSATIAAQTAQIAEQQRIITALEQQRSDAQSPPAASEPTPEPQQQAAADDTATVLPRIAVGSDPAPDTPADAVTIAVGSEPAVAMVADGDTDLIGTPEPAADAPGEMARLRDALKQSKSELATLKQERAELQAENAALGDAGAIIAYFFRDSVMDDATWAARVQQLRMDIEARDDDNDFLHLLQFPHGMRPEMDNFFMRVLLDDKTLDPTLVKDFRAYVDKMRSVAEKIEKRGLAAQQGEYVPAETFTVELALTALGEPAPGRDAPPAPPNASIDNRDQQLAEQSVKIETLTATLAGRDTELAELAAQLRAAEDAAAKLNEATSRLEQSESELASLKQDHAALKVENVAFGDAAAIVARLYRMADVDDAQWAAKLKEVRAAMEKGDTDNDAVHIMLFVDHPDRILDRFLLQAQRDDGSVHPAITLDLQSFAEKFRPVLEKLEQRNAAAQQGEYVPAETFTVEMSLSALGQPAPGSDAPPASPATPPSAPRAGDKPARKGGRSSKRAKK